MAATSQRYDVGIMFGALRSGICSSSPCTRRQAEGLFVLYSLVTRLPSSGPHSLSSVFVVPGCYPPIELLTGDSLDSWEAVFLSWSWPRNALILFIIIKLFPPQHIVSVHRSQLFLLVLQDY